jgi:2-amino-4-hydroxy-6-hydroxymethyldihydropteridine diphosphokinase
MATNVSRISSMTERRAAAGAAYDAILALGSNMGDARANLDRAVALLTTDRRIRLVARSRDYATPAWGVTDQAAFVNGAIAVATELPPEELLGRCQAVEHAMGRVRTRHWGPRVIDVDILVYRDAVIDRPELKIPHSLIAERAFVLAPLADIAPGLVVDGRTVAERLAGIDRTGVTPL